MNAVACKRYDCRILRLGSKSAALIEVRYAKARTCRLWLDDITTPKATPESMHAALIGPVWTPWNFSGDRLRQLDEAIAQDEQARREHRRFS